MKIPIWRRMAGALRRLTVLLLTAAVISVECRIPSVSADGTGANNIPVTVTYRDMGTKEIRDWTFIYNDEFFTASASEYNHDLARISLGLAMSAFRNRWLPLGEHQTEGVKFLETLGFQDIRPEGYETEPTADSISTILGHKQIGDVALVALGICGSGYADEWISNLTVGSEERHTGFDRSARIVEQRIRDYLTDCGITGSARLWLSGFSRAAAVSNITAADMTDSGIFEEVYNISFATPRTTRDKGNYPNIFNIVGKNDPVAMIPIADWGYVRYGTDLYTPSQEADSRYAAAAKRTSEQTELRNGKGFRNNPDLNDQLRTVLDFLLAVMPESADYENDLQQGVIKAWANKKNDGFVNGILQALEDLDSQTTEERSKELRQLIAYLNDIVSDYVSGSTGQVEAGSWDNDVSLVDNVLHEHNPDVYLDWIFAFDDPEMLYTGNTGFLRFTVSGDVTVTVTGENGMVETNLTRREDLPEKLSGTFMGFPTDPDKEFHEVRLGSQTTVILPRDELYLVTVYSNKDQEISYSGAAFDPAESVKGTLGPVHTLQTERGGVSYLLVGEDDDDPAVNLDEEANETLTAWDTSLPYSPSMLIRLEKNNYFHLTLAELFLIALYMFMIFGLLLVISIVLAAIRLIRRRRRSERTTIVFHVLVALLLFLLEEIVRDMVPGYPIAKASLKGLISFSILILALKGMKRGGVAEAPYIALYLLVCIPSDFLMSMAPLWGVIGYTAAVLILCVCLIRKKKPSLRQILVWLIAWVAVTAGGWFFRDMAEGIFIPVVFCAGASLALLVLAVRAQRGFRWGTIVFFTSLLLLAGNHLFAGTSGSKFLSLSVYYIAEFIFAVTVWGRNDRITFRKSKKRKEAAAV